MDLFGDIDDISSESDEDRRTSVPRQSAGEHRMSRGPQEEEPVSETRIKVEIPSINSDLGNELYFVRLPRFLRIEPKPFEPRLYENEFEDEKVLYEEDRTRLKLKVENTIRWRVRQNEEGYKVKESNARIIKWSDGSMSLHLGSEVFDVYQTPLQDNHNQLFIREDTGLRGQAIFKSRLSFRPHSTDSATYKKMALSFGNRSSKTQIRILPISGQDPECQHREMTKRKSRQASRSAFQDSDSDDEEKGEEEEEEEEEEEKSEVEIEEEEEQSMSSSGSDEGSKEEKARELVKAKRLASDGGSEPSRKRKAGSAEEEA